MRISASMAQILRPRAARHAAALPRTVHLRVRAVPALSAALAGTLLATTLAVLLLCYRLAAQFTASVPSSGPAVWLYDAAGLLVLPFRPVDTTQASASRVLEFPALVALEAFLAIGCLLGFLTFAGLRLARRLGSPVAEIYLDLDAIAGYVARFRRSAQAFAGRSVVALGSAWLYAVAYVETRDWEAMRRKLEAAGLRSCQWLKGATEAASDSVNLLAADLAASAGRGAARAGDRARPVVAKALSRAEAAVTHSLKVRDTTMAACGDAVGRLRLVAGRAASGRRLRQGQPANGLSRREFFHRLGAGGAH